MKIILVMATTLDGKIAQNVDQNSLNWTSREDTQLFIEKTKEAGTMIMGMKTYTTIGKPLKGRRIIVIFNPAMGGVFKNIGTWNTDGTPELTNGVVEFTSEEPKEIVARLAADAEKSGKKDATAILAGGATINGMFLGEDLIDEMFITIEPVVFGSGINLFEGPGAINFGSKNMLKLELVKTQKLSDNAINLHYKVIK